jgi:hypothetical protein
MINSPIKNEILFGTLRLKGRLPRFVPRIVVRCVHLWIKTDSMVNQVRFFSSSEPQRRASCVFSELAKSNFLRLSESLAA